MDENKPPAGSRSPSLLADNLKAPPRSSNGHSRASALGRTPATSTRKHRYVPVALALVLAGVLVGAAILALGVRAARFPADGVADPATRLPAGGALANASAIPGSGNAVILPADPAPDVAAADIHAVTPGPGTPQAAIARPAQAVAAASQPSKSAGSPRRTQNARTPRLTRPEDGDVALLAALIQHVEDGQPAGARKPAASKAAMDPMARAVQGCPAANTRAGVECIRKLCAQHVGQSIACPAPAASEASRDVQGETADRSD